MISTFDLTLLGGGVSLGGALFLLRAYRDQMLDSVFQRSPVGGLFIQGRGERQHFEAIAGVRWLTVGMLTLFLGYTRGVESGYLFGPWMDVTFHVILISGSWVATASRINTLRSRQVITPEPAPLTPLETGTHSSRLPETVG